ncbi:MAG: GGDEF domain-containing protein [Lachnospiraceae bacterium]|nr:GGDEF domain-containing protein [Lachnospiraceae bacterium]
MKTIAFCVGSIFDKGRFLLADKEISRIHEAGDHVLLLPVGMASRALDAKVRGEIGSLYFLEHLPIDGLVAVPGESMNREFLDRLQRKCAERKLPYKELHPEEGAVNGTPEKEEVWQSEMVNGNERMAAHVFSFTDEMLSSDDVGEISRAMEHILPKDTFLCMRGSFLQDLYANEGRGPLPYEKYYILADKRANPSTWKTFTLDELFPDAKSIFDTYKVVTLIPIHCKEAYFGYMVHVADTLDGEACSLELCSVILDLTIGRYITERRLMFANNELFNVNENMRKLKETDMLTGLRNSRGFRKDLERMLKEAHDAGKDMVTVCVDLDRLGNINDVYGHGEGDIAIQTMSQIIRDSLPEGGVAARIGADEFIVAMPQNDWDDASSGFSSILEGRLTIYNRISGKEYTLEANISSMIVRPEEKNGVDEVLDESFAKKRMLKENRGSRRSMRMFAEDEDKEEEHAAVRKLLDNNDFRYAYQPIVSAKTGEVVAYEALMRTRNEQGLSPLTILKYAAMDERLYDIELATFSNVLKQMDQLYEELGNRKIFVNSIPGHYLDETDYMMLRRKHQRIFGHLVVEVTEETDFEDESVSTLKKRSGEEHFEVAVDDFGNGYSNMSNLLKCLPNYVKIDRSLIENVHEDPKKQHFVKTIIEFAHDNGFQALAEGVENTYELAAVIRMGVDLIQGYYTARPAFVLAGTISSTVRDEIVRANVEGGHELKKKIYIVSREKELFLMQLAMERYTGIVVSQEHLILHGNPDYTAGIGIKIKDGCECRLTIRNVNLGDLDIIPCIEIGHGATLTLVVEGHNEFSGNGIHVPEDSILRLEGDGTLAIVPSVSESFCIGAPASGVFGNIVCAMNGALLLRPEGNRCVAIGGGRSSSLEGINIVSGKFDIALSGMECVGIGCFEGDVSVRMTKCNMEINAKVSTGVMIGAMHGRQDIQMKDSRLEITAAGNCIAGLGSIHETQGSIRVSDSGLYMRFNGRKLFLIGGKGGALSISVMTSTIGLAVEGSMAIGIGTVDKAAFIELLRSSLEISMRVGEPIVLGVAKRRLQLEGGSQKLFVNEKTYEIEDREET